MCCPRITFGQIRFIHPIAYHFQPRYTRLLHCFYTPKQKKEKEISKQCYFVHFSSYNFVCSSYCLLRIKLCAHHFYNNNNNNDNIFIVLLLYILCVGFLWLLLLVLFVANLKVVGVLSEILAKGNNGKRLSYSFMFIYML